MWFPSQVREVEKSMCEENSRWERIRMGSRLLASIFLLAFAAAPAVAAPDARFTARKVQGPTCVAPCAVHVDAIGMGALSPNPWVTPETTDPAFDREFHSLTFQWTFGDPASGTWQHTGVRTPRSAQSRATSTRTRARTRSRSP